MTEKPMQPEAVRCSLCEIAQRQIVRGEYWTLVLNANQSTLGRVFFALNRHLTDVTSITDAEQRGLWRGLRVVKATLDALFAPDHYNYVFLMNVDPHVHMHVYPRYMTDRRYLTQPFTDTMFGRHYDASQRVQIDPTVETSLIDAINADLASRGAIEF